MNNFFSFTFLTDNAQATVFKWRKGEPRLGLFFYARKKTNIIVFVA